MWGVTILDKEKKQNDLLEEQHFRLDRLVVRVKGHGARLDALTTHLEGLEAQGGSSADLMVVMDNIAMSRAMMVELKSTDITSL